MPHDPPSLEDLSDAELVARLKALAARERHSAAQVAVLLAEVERRDLHLREGYGSLFEYCRDALAQSEHDAYNRITAARAVRRYPLVLDLLAAGSINLTTLRLLAPHLTPDNHRAVLESAVGKRKAQVEEIVAKLLPRPDVPLSIRKLPPPRFPAAGPEIAGSPGGPEARGASPSGGPSRVTPLSPDRYKVQLTISGETLEKLQLAKDMLRHVLPSGNDAAVVERALSVLLTDLAKKKFGGTDQPRPSAGATPGSRHIPAEVKRSVWLRDLGRCAFVGTNGRRCTERGFLEFHHVHPYAVGGKATVDNVELRCRRHNDYEARVYFGVG